MAFVGFWMIPLMFIYTLLSPIFGLMSGGGKTGIILPHDPENGIVWEYKSEEEVYVELISNKIDDGQQIFTFRGRDLFDEKRPSSSGDKAVDDVLFEDGNGTVKRYFVFVDYGSIEHIFWGDLKILEDTECVSFEYTVKPKAEVADAYWYVVEQSDEVHNNVFVGEDKLKNVHERTYEFVLEPKQSEDHTFSTVFSYKVTPSAPSAEKIEVTFEIVDKEVRVIEEKHFIRNENGNMIEVA